MGHDTENYFGSTDPAELLDGDARSLGEIAESYCDEFGDMFGVPATDEDRAAVLAILREVARDPAPVRCASSVCPDPERQAYQAAEATRLDQVAADLRAQVAAEEARIARCERAEEIPLTLTLRVGGEHAAEVLVLTLTRGEGGEIRAIDPTAPGTADASYVARSLESLRGQIACDGHWIVDAPDPRRARAEEILEQYHLGESHTHADLVEALVVGVEVWDVDTAGTDPRELLVGDRDIVVEDVLDRHNLDELPEGWTLERVGPLEDERAEHTAEPGAPRIRNLTPHQVRVELNGEGTTYLPDPEGLVARVSDVECPTVREVEGAPVISITEGQVTGLPGEDEAPGTIYIVSRAVASYTAVLGRPDVVAPDTGPTAIRDSSGHVVAVRGWRSYRAR